MDKVPASQVGLNIGSALVTHACSVVLLVVAVVVEVAVVAATFAITGAIDLEHMTHIDAADIKKMGAAASARELVRLRRSHLKQKGRRRSRP